MKMTGSNCLLDTNIIIQLFNGDTAIAKKLDALSTVYIPSIVAGELFYGAHASEAKTKNLKKIISFLSRCIVLHADISTAEYYGKIKAALRKKGKPIPENDIWIGAVAQQYKLVLITKDKHFKNIDTLKVKSW